MKKSFLITAVLFTYALTSYAGNSIVVQEGGCNCQVTTSPSVYNYSSINAATTAAATVTGDTIYIRNRAGNLPWSENVTISKSLTIVPYNNDDVFYCLGNWTITGTGGQTINIVGMYNYYGSVAASAAATSGSANSRCTVRLLGGQLGTGTGTNSSGYINFNFNYYDLWVYGMKIMNGSANSAVTFQHGSLIGDSIVNNSGNCGPYAVQVVNDGASNADTCFIIGNIISQTACGSYAGIYWNNSQIAFDMRNNLIYSNDYAGIYVNQTKPAITPPNKIHNNTVVMTGSAAYTSPGMYALYLNPNATGPGVIEVVNNVLARTQSTSTYQTFGIYNANASGVVNCFYNMIDNKLNLVSGAYMYQVGANANNTNAVSTIGTLLGTGPISTTYPPTQTTTQAGTSLGYPISSASFNSPNNIVGGGNPGLAFSNFGTYAANGTTNGYTTNTLGCYGGPYNIQTHFAPSATYPYLGSGPARSFITPSMVPLLFTTGAAISTGSFKSAHFDK